MNPPSDDLLRLYFLAECRQLGLQAIESGEHVVVTYARDPHLQEQVSALLNKYVGFRKSIAIPTHFDPQTGQVRYEIPFHLLTGQDVTPDELDAVDGAASHRLSAELASPTPQRPDEPGPDGLTARQRAGLLELPEEARPAHAQLFRIGNASVHYHQAREMGFNPTVDDWREWLAGLPERMRTFMAAEGFEAGKRALPFRRYYLERRDAGLDEFMRQHLSNEDYAAWRELTAAS